MVASVRHLNILGIRGIPAAHGGFETFAGHFAPYMRDSGWTVTVYCQAEEGVNHPQNWSDEWEGIQRIYFQTRTRGALSTMEFDLRCILNARDLPGVDLVLGYNTAIFCVLQRLSGRPLIMNMDGIEWRRRKWGKLAKAWFWLNEWIGSRICTVPIADHPEIAAHLASRGCDKAVVIPYGSAEIVAAPVQPIITFGLKPHCYFITIARLEPENSIAEIIEAFIAASTGHRLMVLGTLEPDRNAYHARLKAIANETVIFPGAIYDPEVLRSLRFHCLAYVHGHQIGGTNPSLVEALGAGNPVIAHDNKFNRWTAGDGQLYFGGTAECAAHMSRLASDATELCRQMSQAARARHHKAFLFDHIHRPYRDLLEGLLHADCNTVTGYAAGIGDQR